MQSLTLQSSPSCRGWFSLPLTSVHPYSKLSRHSDGQKSLVVIHWMSNRSYDWQVSFPLPLPSAQITVSSVSSHLSFSEADFFCAVWIETLSVIYFTKFIHPECVCVLWIIRLDAFNFYEVYITVTGILWVIGTR